MEHFTLKFTKKNVEDDKRLQCWFHTEGELAIKIRHYCKAHGCSYHAFLINAVTFALENANDQ